MKFAQYFDGQTQRLGLVEGEEIVDLATGNARLPTTLAQLLAAGNEAMEAARDAAGSARRLPLTSVRLGPPVYPRKFLGLGLGYRSHVEEMRKTGMTIPEHQVWFSKLVTCLNGPYDPIHVPQVSPQLDYEGELAIVIGKRARHVKAADAKAVIAGYMVCNDVTVRDWQKRSPTAMLGKSFDTHGPVGPWMTTADEVPNPDDLYLKTWVDGELRQDGRTSDMAWTFGAMIEELSSVFTLEPGDILSTGTPGGVGVGFNPPRFLTPGQVVRVEIEGLGYIENRVIAEPQ
ncbi:fumarylacetoacetate hydrolase family protein [Asticcacaulis sp.]|uniref:fumarylacetoacetate hydrolase family protein n=1 Tax=Asticcacaulis sp. TaxID=1872648 RepID=UPI002BE69400|nr:fumarylacetoacetate hydrolase family protein [Asticcacaulis sp.]HTM81607.1 fumarylacetoacetate hydrolase family protein [Asticcacaulis sp.]